MPIFYFSQLVRQEWEGSLDDFPSWLYLRLFVYAEDAELYGMHILFVFLEESHMLTEGAELISIKVELSHEAILIAHLEPA